jgi:hypothetical protein
MDLTRCPERGEGNREGFLTFKNSVPRSFGCGFISSEGVNSYGLHFALFCLLLILGHIMRMLCGYL